jgi:hypothetical protein
MITKIIPTRVRQRFSDSISIAEKLVDYDDDSIFLPNIIEMICEYWLSNIDRELIYKPDGQLWVDGEKAIAKIPRESEDKVRKVIDNLKKDSILNSILNGVIGTGGLRFKRNELMQKAIKLGKEIQDNIVFKIDSEQYERTCDYCPKDSD